MLNLIGKIKFHNGRRISHFTSFSTSAPKFFALPSSRSIASNPYSESSNQNSFPATNLQNPYEFSPEYPFLDSNYLQLDSPNYLQLDSPVDPNSVIPFFKNLNFSDTQISIIVKKWPSVFNYVPAFRFRHKIDFFRNLGLSSSDITKILTMAPYLLERSLYDQLIPIVDFLRSFLRSDRNVVLSIMRYPFILDANLHDTLLHNVGILRVAGVPEHHIVVLLQSTPGKIAVKPESFRAMVDDLQKLGLQPHRRKFIAGIKVMRQLSNSTWNEKINFYNNRFGWSEHEVLDAFRMHPRFMSASMDKITRALDLLADQMGCDLALLIKRPQILTLNFERILVPRCALYQVFLSKGLVEQGSLLAMMDCIQSFSIGSFVLTYANIDHRLLEVYIKKIIASRGRSLLGPSL